MFILCTFTHVLRRETVRGKTLFGFEGMFMKFGKRLDLNLRDLGGIPLSDGSGTVPKGLFLRSGKLGILTKDACASLCRKHNIKCVIDLRTPVESDEFPDPLPDDVEYMQIPLLKDSAVGITHETGSDPMTIIRNLRRHPEKLKEMIPDFPTMYRQVVTDGYSRPQLEKAVETLLQNGREGKCTLFHCTAGKDRTGIVSMALLKHFGVADKEIVRDYMRTNRYALLPTLKKCFAVALLTQNGDLVKTAYKSFMADRDLIETAIRYYNVNDDK